MYLEEYEPVTLKCTLRGLENVLYWSKMYFIKMYFMTHKPESPGCLLQKLHLQYRPIVVYKKLNAHAWNFLSHSYQVYRRKYLIFFFYLWTLFIKYEDQSIYAYKNISFLPSHFVYLVSCLPQPYTQNFGLFALLTQSSVYSNIFLYFS